jgi:hypothetical protein
MAEVRLRRILDLQQTPGRSHVGESEAEVRTVNRNPVPTPEAPARDLHRRAHAAGVSTAFKAAHAHIRAVRHQRRGIISRHDFGAKCRRHDARMINGHINLSDFEEISIMAVSG